MTEGRCGAVPMPTERAPATIEACRASLGPRCLRRVLPPARERGPLRRHSSNVVGSSSASGPSSADAGLGVVVISHNIDVVFEVADRIVVLYVGRVVATFERASTTRDDVVSAIVGVDRANREDKQDESAIVGMTS